MQSTNLGNIQQYAIGKNVPFAVLIDQLSKATGTNIPQSVLQTGMGVTEEMFQPVVDFLKKKGDFESTVAQAEEKQKRTDWGTSSNPFLTNMDNNAWETMKGITGKSTEEMTMRPEAYQNYLQQQANPPKAENYQDMLTRLGTQAKANTAADELTYNQPIVPVATSYVAPKGATREQIISDFQLKTGRGITANELFAAMGGQAVQTTGTKETDALKGITSESFNQQKNIDLSSTGGTGAGTYDRSGATSAAESMALDMKTRQDALNLNKTPEQIQSEGIVSQQTKDLDSMTGKAALTTEKTKELVDPLQTQLTSINNQIQTKMADKARLLADQQGKPVTMSSIIGSQAQINAVMNADILTLTAQANALMNNITLAEKQVQQAVDAKYAPIEERIAISTAQLAALKPTLDKQEKVQAEALDAYYTAQKQAIADKKTEDKNIQSLSLQYIQDMTAAGKTPDMNVVAKLKDANSMDSAMAIYAKSAPVKKASGSGGSGIVDSTTQYYAEQINGGMMDITDVPATYKNSVISEIQKPKTVDLIGTTFNGLTATFADGSSLSFPNQSALDKFKSENNLGGDTVVIQPNTINQIQPTTNNTWTNSKPLIGTGSNAPKGIQPVVDLVKSAWNWISNKQSQTKAKQAAVLAENAKNPNRNKTF